MLCWPRDLSSKGRDASTRRCNNDSIELEVRTTAQPLWTPSAPESTKKGVTVLAGVIDSDKQGEIGLRLCNGGKEKCVWDTEDPLGPLSVLPHPVIEVKGKLQHSNPVMATNCPVRSGMKVWVTPLGKGPQSSEGLLKAKETE